MEHKQHTVNSDDLQKTDHRWSVFCRLNNYLVELQGLEPWTSSMPWKHSSQLSYSPVPIYSSKKSPHLTETTFLSCYAPTRGAMFVLTFFVLTLNGTPLAYQLMLYYPPFTHNVQAFHAHASIVDDIMIK